MFGQAPADAKALSKVPDLIFGMPYEAQLDGKGED
jgi:hypothetical protein